MSATISLGGSQHHSRTLMGIHIIKMIKIDGLFVLVKALGNDPASSSDHNNFKMLLTLFGEI